MTQYREVKDSMGVVRVPQDAYYGAQTQRAIEKYHMFGPDDRVLVAVGRSPNGKRINAEAAGVNVDERGFIPADAHMRTNVPHIYAIGDVVGNPMLAHKATHEAKVVDIDGDGRADLAVGAPSKDIGSIDAAGSVNVLYGTAGGLSASGEQWWHQDSDGIAGDAFEDDFFSHSIAPLHLDRFFIPIITLIFADGFESGETSAWSASVP